MSSEVVENGLATTPDEPDRMLMPLEDAPFTMKTLRTLIGTPSVPDRYKNSPTGVSDMYAAYLVGKELGIGPMESINSIFLVNGQTSMLGRLMCAQIWRHGHGLKVEVGDKEVTAIAFRRDPVSKELYEAGRWVFGDKDAKKAYLDDKSTYENYPKLMWSWRAISALSRIYFADCMSGIGYVPEELGIDTPVEQLPETVALTIDEGGQKNEIEQASAVVEEILDAEVVTDKS